MRAARFLPNGVALEDVEPEPLRPGWIRLSVQACGICGSDLHAWARSGDEPACGRIPGHEIAGRVWRDPLERPGTARSGPSDAGLEQRLAQLRGSVCVVDPRIGCGVCDFCSSGSTQLCPRGELIGVTRAGGFAQLVDAPLANVHALPAGVEPREAVFAEPLAVAVRALAVAQVGLESRVLVLGAGALGLVVARLARECAGRVAISARHPHQLAAAEELRLSALREGQEAEWSTAHAPDVVIETVGGRADTLRVAVDRCRSGGRIVVLGLFDGDVRIDARQLVLRELRLAGSNTYGATARGTQFEAALDWLPRLRGDLARLVTHVYPLEEADAALRCAADKSAGSIKVCLTMDDLAGA